MSVNQRIKKFAEAKKISQAQFKADLKIKSRAQVSNWFTDKERIPDRIVIKIIAKYPDLNARWFITGQGEMFDHHDNNISKVTEPMAKYGEMAQLKDQIESLETRLIALATLLDVRKELDKVMSKSIDTYSKILYICNTVLIQIYNSESF